MCKIALILLSLACVGHSRRVQPSGGNVVKESKVIDTDFSSPSSAQAHHPDRQWGVKWAFDRLQALAEPLLAFNPTFTGSLSRHPRSRHHGSNILMTSSKGRRPVMTSVDIAEPVVADVESAIPSVQGKPESVLEPTISHSETKAVETGQHSASLQQDVWKWLKSLGCGIGIGGMAGTVAAATIPGLSTEISGVEGEANLQGVTGVKRFGLAFWKFLRPHTIRGTILACCAITSRVVLENPTAIDWHFMPRTLLVLFCLLCGNAYCVGINQIYDVEIDSINKPFLPIAAGELSKSAAWVLCIVLAAAGVALSATYFGSLITSLYAFGLFLGTVYSAPPLRLKRFPVAAFLCVAIARGFLLNFIVYYAALAAMHQSPAWSPTILFATCFATCFSVVIALGKDLPDIEGDRTYGVRSFAVRLGADRLSYIAAGVLVTLYVAAAALPLVFPGLFRLCLMTPLHLTIAGLVVRATLRLRHSNWSQPAIKKFYKFIWSIFYANWFFLPFLAPLR
mmetsp:Transcript_72861/g.126477  ORF Transcript_72861/g.126477 Transcript_72861/m.126477 type:complete len:509 (+) Transcript_72861:95-1621(+)